VSKDRSLKKRFTFKLASNLWGVALALVTMSFVSRALGPEGFGRFEFITSNFKLVLETMTLQVPVAYFNWVSRKGHKEGTLVASGLTLYFSLAMTAAFALFIALAIGSGVHATLWPGIEPVYLWEGLLFTLVVFLYQLLVFLSDGMSLTVGLEKIRLLQNFLKAASLLTLVGIGLMNLHAYFFAQIAVVSLTVALSARWLTGQGALSWGALKFRSYPAGERERFLAFVIGYARPLTVLMCSGFVFIYFDRWFLQLIGGAVQQGYFGLSDRLGAIAFIFTSAMTPLLTREFALAHEERDQERLLRLFGRIRLFLFIATLTSCFLSVQSAAVVKLIGGDKFQGAVLPIAIMALFPIHQTFGQLSGALLVATGQTGLYSRIGIAAMVCSLPLTYFLMAPGSFAVPGWELGATGLAVKMVAVQFLATNVQLYCNTRYLGISYAGWALYQALMIPLVYAVALATSFACAELFAATNLVGGIAGTVALFAVSGLLYCLTLAVVVCCFPGIVGSSRAELAGVLRRK
jgi:O-antigen/teichoic acid export membrane protein